MKKPQVIFFDIDGTLLSHEQRVIPESAKAALSKAKAQGIKLFISTGRHMSFINEHTWLNQFPFDGYVTLNGGFCTVGDDIVHKTPINATDISNVIDYIKANEVNVILCEKDEQYIVRPAQEAWKIAFENLGAAFPPIMDITRTKENEVYQLCVHDQTHMTGLLPLMPHSVSTTWAWDGFDIISKDSNKFVGVSKVVKYLGIPMDEVAAVGDGDNDKELLTGVGIGIAMGNAEDHVKAAANYVTAHIDEDGIEEAVEYLLSL